jgi:hypothetical protein
LKRGGKGLAVGLAAALVGAALLVGQAGATGIASSNVEYITTVPFDAGLASSARLVGHHLFVGGSKTLSIYDVSEPEAPVRVSTTFTGVQFPNEDIDTNGRILVMMDQTVEKKLHVWDVEDKAAPVELASLEMPPPVDHTFTCVLDCRYAYGSRGHIVDLKNPAKPQLVGSWGAMAPNDGFDLTEVSPGRVLSASRQILYLDGRKDPLHPEPVARGYAGDERVIHSNRWPRRGKDRFFLVQGETPLSGVCDEDSGAFMTWDASKWRKTHTFTLIDEYRVANGTFVDGSPPAGALGCTNMWFDEHPDFRNGGLVASGFFEHGTRFLDVDKKGQISEVGYFLPAGGETIAAYWITDDIVYAIDQTRGIDILRFTP